LTTPSADYIVDPFADLDFSPFGALLGDPDVEKIFHASEYDLILMKREFDWDVLNLFDTMWAARILGYRNMGLANFLREFYEITLSKKHQKANWGKRPLTEAQLAYAQRDTHYLLDLRDRFAAMLEEKGCMREAREIFRDVAVVRLPDRSFDPDNFWKVRGARDLPPERLGVLRALYVWRDGEAKRRDQPVFKVMSDSTLSKLAELCPQTVEELERVKGMSPRLISHVGRRLLHVISDGLRAPRPRRPKRTGTRTSSDVRDRFDLLVEWRKRAAQARGVESDVIMHRETLWDIANQNPRSAEDLGNIESLGPVRRELYGEHLLDFLD
jgi:ribonuclease D